MNEYLVKYLASEGLLKARTKTVVAQSTEEARIHFEAHNPRTMITRIELVRENVSALVNELANLMQTNFNGIGWIRMKEILDELGIDPQIPSNKLVAKLEELTGKRMGA